MEESQKIMQNTKSKVLWNRHSDNQVLANQLHIMAVKSQKSALGTNFKKEYEKLEKYPATKYGK